MIRRISKELLDNFRTENFPVCRLRLSKEEKDSLAENVEISEDGTVYYKGKIVKHQLSNGYSRVDLSLLPNKYIKFSVHRLVLWESTVGDLISKK